MKGLPFIPRKTNGAEVRLVEGVQDFWSLVLSEGSMILIFQFILLSPF
jgi:hypothetical protein